MTNYYPINAAYLRAMLSDKIANLEPKPTDHLPECIYKPENVDSAKGIRWGGRPCICDALRACEQRVREEDQRSLIKYGVQMFMRGKQYGRPMAYAAGVQAARDAVLALPVIDRYDKWWSIDGPQALAAIDALKEKP